jgi:hypothetical protein
VPFSPVTGPRLLVRPGGDTAARRNALIAGLMEVAKRAKVSSLHITFPTEEEWKVLGEAGLMQREGSSSTGTIALFDLRRFAQLTSRKRKSIRKERREANAEVKIETLSGDDLKPRHMDAFYEFYMNTVGRKWANDYLNQGFFRRLQATLADKIVLVMASHDGDYVGAINLRGLTRCSGAISRSEFPCSISVLLLPRHRFAIEHKRRRWGRRAGAAQDQPRLLPPHLLGTDPRSEFPFGGRRLRQASGASQYQMEALEEERSPHRRQSGRG